MPKPVLVLTALVGLWLGACDQTDPKGIKGSSTNSASTPSSTPVDPAEQVGSLPLLSSAPPANGYAIVDIGPGKQPTVTYVLRVSSQLVTEKQTCSLRFIELTSKRWSPEFTSDKVISAGQTVMFHWKLEENSFGKEWIEHARKVDDPRQRAKLYLPRPIPVVDVNGTLHRIEVNEFTAEYRDSREKHVQIRGRVRDEATGDYNFDLIEGRHMSGGAPDPLRN